MAGRTRDILDRTIKTFVRGVLTQERAAEFFEAKGEPEKAERARERLEVAKMPGDAA